MACADLHQVQNPKVAAAWIAAAVAAVIAPKNTQGSHTAVPWTVRPMTYEHGAVVEIADAAAAQGLANESGEAVAPVRAAVADFDGALVPWCSCGPSFA